MVNSLYQYPTLTYRHCGCIFSPFSLLLSFAFASQALCLKEEAYFCFCFSFPQPQHSINNQCGEIGNLRTNAPLWPRLLNGDNRLYHAVLYRLSMSMLLIQDLAPIITLILLLHLGNSENNNNNTNNKEADWYGKEKMEVQHIAEGSLCNVALLGLE